MAATHKRLNVDDAAEECDAVPEKSQACSVRHAGFCLCSCCCCLLCASFCFFLFLNQIVKSTLIVAGTYALGVETEVAAVSIGVISTKVTILGIRFGNPLGFDGDFLNLESAEFDMKGQSLLSPPYEIQEFSLKGFHVNVQVSSDGESNAKQIMERLDKRIKEVVPDKTAPSVEDDVRSLTVKFVADDIECANISANVTHPWSNTLGPMTYQVDDIHTANIGKEENGIELYKLISRVVWDVTTAVISGVPGQVGQNLQSSAGHLIETLESELHATICNACPQAIEVTSYSSYDVAQTFAYSREDFAAFTGTLECTTVKAEGTNLYVWVKQDGRWYSGSSKWGYSLSGGSRREWNCTELREP